MKKTISFISLICTSLMLFSQTDYKTSTKNKDGFTSIYNTIYIKPTTTYGSSTSITKYGLLDEKTKKVVLPLLYKMAYTAYEDGLYIVQDSSEKHGLYNAKTQKFLIQPVYNKIEGFSEGVAVVQKESGSGWDYNYTYGVIDKAGKLILPDTFEYLGNCREGLMSFSQNKKYGFINTEGKVIIPPSYHDATYFCNGLACVRETESSKYGYINKTNKFAVEPKYVYAEGFYQGYATAYYEKKYWASRGGASGTNKVVLLNAKGIELTQPIYETISLRKDGGIFRVTQGDKQGLIDSTGKLILPVENKDVGEFYGGIARVEKTSGMFGLVDMKGKWVLPADYNEVLSLYDNKGFYVKKDGKYSVLDKNIKTIIPPDSAKRVVVSKKNIAFIFNDKVKIFDLAGKLTKTVNQPNIDLYGTNFYSNDDSLKVPYFKSIGLYNLQTSTMKKLEVTEVADFNEEGIFVAQSAYKWNFYDFTGKKLYDKSFENVVNFSDGICGLQESSYSKPYLADKSLNKIAELTTVFYGPYSEGLAMSKSQYGGTLYYLDKKGVTQFTVYADEGGVCKNGKIRIKSGTKYYYVNTNGKTINNNTYDDLGDYHNGLAGFKTNGKCGYIDTSGKTAIAAIYDEVSNFSNGVAIVKRDGDYYQIDKTGRAFTNAKYLAASDPDNGTFPVKKSTGFGLIDDKGNTLIDFKYQDMKAANENVSWAKKNNKWGLVNTTGIEITPFDYEDGGVFEDGYARVSKNKKWGLVDKTGKTVLPVEYAQLSKVYKNTIIVVKPSGTATFSLK